MLRLATVSPCFNEEDVVRSSAERLTALFRELIDKGKISDDSMMVFVNDGSKDNTWKVIAELHEENPFVRGINLSHNVGHQNAIMAGMMTARQWADAVITIDADLQDSLVALEQMIDRCNEGFDVVYGVKVSRKADPLLKRLTAEAFYKLQQSMGVESVFNHADFRLLTRRALDMLSEYGERNLYLRGIVPMIGLNSTTVDDVISERTAGHSKFTLRKMFHLASDGILSFSARPIYGLIYMGAVFLFIALCMVVYVVRALILGTAVSGWASLMLSLWLVGGCMLIGMGLLGLYIGKIFVEVKRRPLYHIREILE